MEYCPHCMRPAEGDRCRHCGRAVQVENNPALLPVGAVLTGGARGRSYQIGAVLGQGGFGVTYIALDLSAQRRVAIKEYFPIHCAQRYDCAMCTAACPPNTADCGMRCRVQAKPGQVEVYEGGRYSFLKEAQMLSSLEGMPAVVQGLDYLEVNDTAYLVMEYLDGIPLYRIVNKNGKILAEELLPKLRPLMRDIGKLHAAGVVHRDISPDNIMWMPDGSLKLLDFGSARSLENGKSVTVHYKKGFAPVEQYRTRGQGAYTDVYALAATIYYCLTGVIPPESVNRQMDGVPLQSPIELGAALTPEEEQALLWGMAITPDERPANMDEFARRLFPIEPDVQTAGPAPGPAPIPEPPGPAPVPGPAQGGWFKRYWPILVVAVVAILATIGVWAGIMSLMGAGRATAPAEDDRQTQQSTREEGEQRQTAQSGGVAPSSQEEPAWETPDEGASPSRPTLEPAEEEETVAVTEQGLHYRLTEAGEAVIVGYEGGSGALFMPDMIENCYVTEIGEGAFAGQEELESVFLPERLRTIGPDAFRDCTDLRDIYAYSAIEAQESSFSGCGALRCLVTTESGEGMYLPAACRVYADEMETGVGKLVCVWVLDDGAIYAATDEGLAVLMEIPVGASEVEIPETVYGDSVTWVYEGAFDYAAGGAVTVYMAEDMAFPPELTNMASWRMKEDAAPYTPAYRYLMTCKLVEQVNRLRPEGPRMELDRELLDTAATLAGEFAVTNAMEETSVYDLLDQTDHTYWVANSYHYDPNTGSESDMIALFADALAGPDEDAGGEYVTKVGFAAYRGADGQDYVVSAAIIP